MIAGMFYAFGGMLEAGRIGSATNNLGFMYELDAIAACVVGGVSLLVGRYSNWCYHWGYYLYCYQLRFNLHRCKPLLAIHH